LDGILTCSPAWTNMRLSNQRPAHTSSPASRSASVHQSRPPSHMCVRPCNRTAHMRCVHSRQPPKRHRQLQGSAGTVRPPVLLGQNATIKRHAAHASVLRSDAHTRTADCRNPPSHAHRSALPATRLHVLSNSLFNVGGLAVTRGHHVRFCGCAFLTLVNFWGAATA
jgi:hypothetical protein